VAKVKREIRPSKVLYEKRRAYHDFLEIDLALQPVLTFEMDV
jgi:hypothetical protein